MPKATASATLMQGGKKIGRAIFEGKTVKEAARVAKKFLNPRTAGYQDEQGTFHPFRSGNTARPKKKKTYRRAKVVKRKPAKKKRPVSRPKAKARKPAKKKGARKSTSRKKR